MEAYVMQWRFEIWKAAAFFSSPPARCRSGPLSPLADGRGEQKPGRCRRGLSGFGSAAGRASSRFQSTCTQRKSCSLPAFARPSRGARVCSRGSMCTLVWS